MVVSTWLSSKGTWEEAKVGPIAMVMRRRRLEWFTHMTKREATENIMRAVADLKMEGKDHAP